MCLEHCKRAAKSFRISSKDVFGGFVRLRFRRRLSLAVRWVVKIWILLNRNSNLMVIAVLVCFVRVPKHLLAYWVALILALIKPLYFTLLQSSCHLCSTLQFIHFAKCFRKNSFFITHKTIDDPLTLQSPHDFMMLLYYSFPSLDAWCYRSQILRLRFKPANK